MRWSSLMSLDTVATEKRQALSISVDGPDFCGYKNDMKNALHGNPIAIRSVTLAMEAAYKGLALAESRRERARWVATIKARKAELAELVG